MKKHVMMTFLMAFTLLISPLRNPGGLTQVSAEENPGADLYSVSGNTPQETQSKVSDDLSQEEAVQLDTPTDLCWGDNTDPYRCRWNGVNASTQEPDGLYGRWYHTSDYRVELSRDGQRISSFLLDENSYVVDWESEVETDVLESVHSFGYASTIFESGSYRFRVQACAQPGDQVYRDSEWSEWSDSIEYVRPEQEVESIELYWDEQQAGLMHFACPKDKKFYEEGCHYQAQLYKEGGTVQEEYTLTIGCIQIDGMGKQYAG